MAVFTWHDGALPENIEIKQVYGIIFSKDGRILLRMEGSEYSLAGGRPEVTDNGIEGTLRRELIEEINVSIDTPYLVGYQLVDEEDSSPLFAQVRMVALIDKINSSRPDPDTGRTYGRFLTSPLKAVELLNWGKVGYLQISSAMEIAKKHFGIENFSDSDRDEFI